jgi:hypothetical protein
VLYTVVLTGPGISNPFVIVANTSVGLRPHGPFTAEFGFLLKM